jgi:cell division protein FtsB
VGPVRDYMRQKEQLRTEQLELIEARTVRDDLSRQIKAIGRPDVLEARARELGMVRPGETPYAVRGIAKPAPPPKAPVDDGTGVWGFITGFLG